MGDNKKSETQLDSNWWTDFLSKKKSVFSRMDLIAVLDELKEERILRKNYKYSRFLNHLITELFVLERVKADLPNDKKTERFVLKNAKVHPFEIALSLNPGSYISHYSALFLHDLTHNIPKDIYINREQTPKYSDPENKLTQAKIDYAFSRPMRRTNQIAKFSYNKKKYQVFLLNGKNTGNLGIIKKKTPHTHNSVRLTNLERTLIDCVVRPKYSGGVEEILNAFERAKDDLSVNRLLGMLRKLNYVYLYEKSIYFYLSRTDYSLSQIGMVFDAINKSDVANLNFYLDYQIPKKILDEDIGIYYPKNLQNYNLF
ncbi:hypothetical protein NST77_25890 [Niallia sp. FSL W8-0177]|uniref:type IV toxin-antitoxin system AbiEi family antitoxin domain-containing protein n=1 Tax=Niallia sp. FSL W8-0177 TaxID=2954522 RepID=UPI0030F6011C